MDIFIDKTQNYSILNNIENLPSELEFEIMNMFNMMMMKKNPIPFKDELLNVLSKKYINFNLLFDTEIGKAKIIATIQVILNITENRFVNGEFSGIFYNHLGFQLTPRLIQKLHKLESIPSF